MVEKWARTIWFSAALAAVLAASAGCSDDSGSSGGSDTANDAADSAVDGPQGDSDADEGDVSGDVVSDVTPDTAEEVGADVGADIGDDAGGDVSLDALADVEADVTRVDVASDLGTTEFPICPYETESATADCAALCGAVGTCSGEEAESFCLVFCATAKSILNQGAATALSTCLTTTECDDVPEGEDLGGFCFVGLLGDLPANPDAVAACNAVDAAIETCLGDESDFDVECGAIAPALRSEADEIILDCASQACDAIENCVSAAVCDVLL